jgi:small-conductance mechanosensitive channel
MAGVTALLAVSRGVVEPWLMAAGAPIDDLVGPSAVRLGSTLVGIYALLTTLPALLVAMVLVGWLYWFLEGRIERYVEGQGKGERADAKSLRTHTAKGLRFLNRGLRAVLLFLAIGGFLVAALRFFPRTQFLLASLKNYLGSPIEAVAGAIIGYLPNLGFLIVIGALAWTVLRAVRYVADSIATGSLSVTGFLPEWAAPTYSLFVTLFMLFVLMVSFPYLPGANSEFFHAFSVFVGALLTFGSAGIISNIVAGIVLTYTKSFRIGDVVRIGDAVGVMLEKTIFVVRLRNARNEEITLPSSSVLASSVTNFSARAQTDGLFLTVSAGSGYDVDWRTVHRLMLEAAAATEHIRKEPAPRVWQSSLGDYAVNYELRATTERPELMLQTRSDLTQNVLDAFARAGVEIMTPSILALRDASTLAVPAEQFSDRTAPHGIRVRLDADR